MKQITINPSIKEVCPQAVLGCITCNVNVKESSNELLEQLAQVEQQLLKELTIEEIATLKEVKAARETYKNLGKAPSKYRVSSEALMRRILQKKGIYHINNIVEINNLISIKSHHSVGSYNLDNIGESIELTVGLPNQSYEGIGKALINIENLPVLIDEKSAFGSPTSDSQRAMITKDVTNIMMCIYAFSGKEEIESYLNEATHLLKKYADATNITIDIIE